MRRQPQQVVAIAALIVVYALSAVALFATLPRPHQHFEYMVIGTGSTGVTMLALFLGCIVRWKT